MAETFQGGEEVDALSPCADFRLVERCKADDLAAFDEIVDRYKDRLYNYIRRMTGDALDAEDLTQEVFIKVFLGIKRFRNDSSLQTWLYRIATNLCVDRHRKMQRSPKETVFLDDLLPDPDESPAELVDWEGDPQSFVQRREIQEAVQEALNRLPLKLKTVATLYDIQGIPYEDIARILEIPIGTVKSRLFNARAKLKNFLRPYVEA